eukprot:gene7163-11476_t
MSEQKDETSIITLEPKPQVEPQNHFFRPYDNGINKAQYPHLFKPLKVIINNIEENTPQKITKEHKTKISPIVMRQQPKFVPKPSTKPLIKPYPSEYSQTVREEYLISRMRDQYSFCFWQITLTQNLFSFPLAILSLINLENTKLSITTISIIFSHALFDILYWIFMYFKFKLDPPIPLLIHHLVIVYVIGIVGFLFLEHGKYVLFFIILQILHEGSSPFISILILLKISGITKDSIVMKVLSVTLLITFFICHDIVNLITWKYMIFGDYLSKLPFYCNFVLISGCLFITCLSALWTISFYRETKKLFKKRE